MITATIYASVILAQQVHGIPSVIDGDTIAIEEQRIRLHGIDAPESTQWCRTADGNIWACGEAATEHLSQLIGTSGVTCRVQDIDRYGRQIGICRARGVVLNEQMVRSGNALAYRQYSDEYVEAESEAENAQLGLWQGTFVEPWRWRRGERDQLVSSGTTRRSTEEAFSDRDCGDFDTWEAAQSFFLEAGEGDPHRLDGNNDGIACNALRRN